jgi:hypothetical protein
MILNNDCWIVNLKYELSSIGLEYFFEESSVNQIRVYKIIGYLQTKLCRLFENHQNIFVISI